MGERALFEYFMDRRFFQERPADALTKWGLLGILNDFEGWLKSNNALSEAGSTAFKAKLDGEEAAAREKANSRIITKENPKGN